MRCFWGLARGLTSDGCWWRGIFLGCWEACQEESKVIRRHFLLRFLLWQPTGMPCSLRFSTPQSPAYSHMLSLVYSGCWSADIQDTFSECKGVQRGKRWQTCRAEGECKDSWGSWRREKSRWNRKNKDITEEKTELREDMYMQIERALAIL